MYAAKLGGKLLMMDLAVANVTNEAAVLEVI